MFSVTEQAQGHVLHTMSFCFGLYLFQLWGFNWSRACCLCHGVASAAITSGKVHSHWGPHWGPLNYQPPGTDPLPGMRWPLGGRQTISNPLSEATPRSKVRSQRITVTLQLTLQATITDLAFNLLKSRNWNRARENNLSAQRGMDERLNWKRRKKRTGSHVFVFIFQITLQYLWLPLIKLLFQRTPSLLSLLIPLHPLAGLVSLIFLLFWLILRQRGREGFATNSKCGEEWVLENQSWTWIPAPPPPGCVTLAKWLNFSVTQHLSL